MNTVASLRADVRTIGLVGFAHLASHFFQLVIPPMFPILKEEFGLGYTELGFVMTLFFIVSGSLQTVAGVVADRHGARLVLFSGIALLSFGILLCGLAPSYPLLIAAAVLAGVGNSVFHPAGFSILNARVDVSRLGHAFSVFNIGGHIGWALAPVYLLAMAAWGWRVSLIGAGVLGFAMLALLWTQREAVYVEGQYVEGDKAPEARAAGGTGGLRVLLAPGVLMCFVFFVLLSTSMVGTQNYLIPILKAIYEAPLLLGSSALTAYLLGSAAGTLTGGFVVTRSRHPQRVAAAGVLALALLYLLLASGVVPLILIVAVAAAGGFSLGISLPARDMLVRGIAPEQSRGKIYGFVYSGLDLGAAIAPSLLGWQLDHGYSAGALLTLAGMLLFSIALIAQTTRRHAAVQA